VFGKHISSLIRFLKENKLKYKALNSLPSCLVQFPLPPVGVIPVQLEAGSCSSLQFNKSYYYCQLSWYKSGSDSMDLQWCNHV